MAIIHRTFRRYYDEAARLVRAAREPSSARVTFLADHIDFGLAWLHFHHESEDELLYPKLIERVPDQAAIAEQTKLQHQEIGTALEVASESCKAWQEGPSAETAEALARALDQLNLVVQPHLDEEEQKVVPLAALTLTKKERDAIGKHTVARIPRNKRPVAFGMILEPLEPAERADMMSGVPAPVRILLYPTFIDRPFKKYAAALRTGS